MSWGASVWDLSCNSLTVLRYQSFAQSLTFTANPQMMDQEVWHGVTSPLPTRATWATWADCLLSVQAWHAGAGCWVGSSMAPAYSGCFTTTARTVGSGLSAFGWHNPCIHWRFWFGVFSYLKLLILFVVLQTCNCVSLIIDLTIFLLWIWYSDLIQHFGSWFFPNLVSWFCFLMFILYFDSWHRFIDFDGQQLLISD